MDSGLRGYSVAVNIQLPEEFDFVWNHNSRIFLEPGGLK